MINGKYFINISYRKRIICLGIYFFCGYILLSLVLILNNRKILNDKTSFLLTMIPSLIMGTGSALGELTIMGALRNYPKNLINGWSSGTGVSGIIGALLTLFFNMFKVQTQFLYLFTSPLSLIYLFIYIIQEKVFNVYVTSNKIKYSKTSMNLNEENTNPSGELSEERNPINLNNQEEVDNNRNNNNVSSANDNSSLNVQNFKLAFGYSKIFIINLGLVNKINLI